MHTHVIRAGRMLALVLAALLGRYAQAENAYQLHQWIELIGFDNTKPDYGVNDHISRVGRKPTAVTLLFSTNRFFLMHRNLETDYKLPVRACSYFGRQSNPDRHRQEWTAHQLHALVKELVSRDIDVFAAFFNFKRMPMTDEALDDELGRLSRFLKDYGFTGFHAADGYSPPCHMLDECADADRPRLARENAARFAANIKRMVDTLKPQGFKVYINSCWTRDPYEALFRHGVDYRLLANTGIDGVYVESSAAAMSILGRNEGTETMPLDRNQAMVMRVKASMPNVPCVLLHAINDGEEQWSALRHAPSAAKAEALTLGNVFYGNRRALAGYLSCLSDGLTAAEWEALRATWDLSFTPVKAPVGVRVVWSDRAFDAEFDACAASRDASSNTLLAELIAKGAIVNGIVSVEDALKDESLPLLILNPQFFPQEELTALRQRMASVIEFGRGAKSFRNLPYKMLTEQEKKFPGMPTVQNNWYEPLPENMPAEQEVLAIADTINTVPVPYAPMTPGVRSWAVVMENGRLGVFARNNSSSYVTARFAMLDSDDINPTDVQVHTELPCVPPRTILQLKIAPQEAVMFSLGDRGLLPLNRPPAQ